MKAAIGHLRDARVERSTTDTIDVVEAVLRGVRGVVVVFEAYFDASERDGGSTFVLAGLAFRKSHARKFNAEWHAEFSKYGGCHMRDLAHATGQFKSAGRQECARLGKRAIEIIRSRAMFGTAVSCDLNEVAGLLPKGVEGLEHAYPICARLCMHSIGSLVGKARLPGSVAYFFESGDRYYKAANRFLEKLVSAEAGDAFRQVCRYHSHTFLPKCALLEAADMFAWEYAKYVDETVNKRRRPMRRSLVEIIRDDRFRYDDKRFRFSHIGGSALKKYISEFESIFVGEERG